LPAQCVSAAPETAAAADVVGLGGVSVFDDEQATTSAEVPRSAATPRRRRCVEIISLTIMRDPSSRHRVVF
jgi:hypothetical protein